MTNTPFQIIRDRTDLIIQLITEVKDNSDQSFLGHPYDLDHIVESIKQHCMQIKYANADRENVKRISDGSIDKLYHWSGVLNAIMLKLREMMHINDNASKVTTRDLEGQILSIAEDLIMLLMGNEKVFNDMEFIKDLYNRQLDNHLINRMKGDKS